MVRLCKEQNVGFIAMKGLAGGLITNSPAFDEKIKSFIEEDKKSFGTDFCRGCGYCMPCPQQITINQCARMRQMIRRSPSKNWLTEYWQNEFQKINNCTGCGACIKKCPYGLQIPTLLKKNYEDYQNILTKGLF